MTKSKLYRNKYPTVHTLSVDEVVDLDTLIDFLNTRAGIPRPLAKDKGAVSKKAQEFFDSYPDAKWRALTDLATWAKVKRKRVDMIQLVGSWRHAYKDGFMHILENGSSTNDDTTLHQMLKNVDDEHVRSQMTNAATATERDSIYQTYLDSSGPSDVSHSEDDPLESMGIRS